MPRYESEFPPFFVTVDLVILTIRDGELCVLLVERGGEPFQGRLALPGGFVHIDEDLRDAAYRELKEEAGIGKRHVVLEQLGTYGAPHRDPRDRVVTVAWLALGSDLPEPRAGTDAAAAEWLPVDRALSRRTRLAFDHRQILVDGVERARAKLEYTGYAAALIPQPFTIGELHAVYESVWGQDLDRANFQRKVVGLPGFLKDTGQSREGGKGRPARLFTADHTAALAPPFMRS
ncbi:MAG: NUDIX hydrolase [Intrasporangiaceae bacterium]|nr:NUDIX hydrolase [Intrasporangiaceae bacterium]